MRRLVFAIPIMALFIFVIVGCARGPSGSQSGTSVALGASTVTSLATTSTTMTQASSTSVSQPVTTQVPTSQTSASLPGTTSTVVGSSAPDLKLHSPAKGSPERQAILDALRVPVEKKLGQKVLFVVADIKGQDRYAFMQGRPVQPSGASIDYSRTVYREAVAAGAFDDAIYALLRWSGGSWEVLTYDIGATDVTWLSWATDYGAPRAIFPPTGD